MAPIIFNSPEIRPDSVLTQASSNGSIICKLCDATIFRKIQKFLQQNKIEFTCTKLPVDYTVKVEINGIHIDVSMDESRNPNS